MNAGMQGFAAGVVVFAGRLLLAGVVEESPRVALVSDYPVRERAEELPWFY